MNNYKFINLPVKSILNEAKIATIGLYNQFAAYPVVEYIFNSLFLKISGLLEQKLKTIIFELGKNDIDIRYEILGGTYKGDAINIENNNILKKIIEQVMLQNPKYQIPYVYLWTESIKDVKSIFEHSIFTACNPSLYVEFKNILTDICIEKHNEKNSQKKNTLELPQTIKNIYRYAHNTRNRLAHNLLSPYENYPTLNDFGTAEFKHTNFFLFYCVYNMFDKILIELFQTYTNNLR